MRPIDFVVFDGDSNPNSPVYQVADAMFKQITVLGPDGNFVIRSYYLDQGGMVLEIAPSENT